MKDMERSIFEKLWENNFSRDLSAMKSFWDSRAEDFNENVIKKQGKKGENLEVIDYIISKNIINKNDSVLDIGCGPGRYSMEFGKIAKSVTGIDISSNMLKYAEENVKGQGLSNVDFKLTPWQTCDVEEIGWNNKFDLVFASMTPAINCKESLVKMIKASKKYCFMSGFVYRNSKVNNDLSRIIFGQDYKVKKKSGEGIYCAFNILWNMGFHPEIIYKDAVWENEWELEKTIEDYTLEFSKAGCEDEHLKEKIREYLEDVSKDGKVKDLTESKIAWMLWEV